MPAVFFQPGVVRELIIVLAAAMAALFFATSSARSESTGAIFCVASDGVPGASGDCWDDPLDLQSALNLAAPGSEIWIKQGTYTPGTDAHSAFYLPGDVRVSGGYTGSAEDPEERSTNPALTVLDGIDERYTVVIVAGVSDAILSGVTIKNGAATLIADDATDLQRRGGGMYVSNSTVTLRNVTIANNRARFGGGGIYIDEASSITVHNATFQGNQTTHPQSGRGGALRIREGSTELHDVTFRFNRAIRGGGMFVDGGVVRVENALFAENEAADRGGGISVYSGEIHISRSRFSRNIAIREGAGMFVTRAGARTSIQESEFSQNDAGDGGGGAWIQSRETSLEQSTFNDNTAGTGAAGGLYLGNTTATIANLRVQGNQAILGGGVVFRNADASVANGLITGNRAGAADAVIDINAGRVPPDDPDRENSISDPWRGVITGEIFSSDYLIEAPDDEGESAGGGVFVFGEGILILRNVTIASNVSDGAGAAIYRAGDNTIGIFNSILAYNYPNQLSDGARSGAAIFSRTEFERTTRIALEHSLVDNGCSTSDDLVCLSLATADPLFLDAPSQDDLPTSTGDFQLWFSSPAIDAGDPIHLDGHVGQDLEGNNRFVHKRMGPHHSGVESWLDLGPLEAQIPEHLRKIEVQLAHDTENTHVAVDVRTDSDGVASGQIAVQTRDWSFDDVRLGRIYEHGERLVIDGEAVLTSGALVGFMLEVEISTSTGKPRGVRVRLDSGQKTIWHSLSTSAERRFVVRDPE